jgi:ankyrin repeat protein
MKQAIQNENIDMVKNIIQNNNISINEPIDRFMNTPLMKAVSMNNETIVKILIKAGADVNARDKDMYTPLMKARSPRIAQMLIDHGAKTDVTDDDGYTVLGQAITRNDQPMINFYIDKGINPL